MPNHLYCNFYRLHPFIYLYTKDIMVKKIALLTAWLISSYCVAVNGQQSARLKANIKPFYITSGMDGAIFSSALITQNKEKSTGTIRFSLLNAGAYFHFNFNRFLGAYTGADVKNVGFIQVRDAVSVKHRSYDIGVPVGIKVGNMEMDKAYGFIGGGIEAPVNYREKTFYIRNQKTTFNEWFSERTPALLPYVFAGIKVNSGLSFKAQYYTGNYLNPNFRDKNGNAVYAGYDVHLVMLSAGYMITRKRDRVSLDANNISE